MSDRDGPEVDRIDQVFSEALATLQAEGVNQRVFGAALLELGVTALALIGEGEARIVEQARTIYARVAPPPQPR
ncbi:MAG: hypothetical protein FJX61_01360 [Alphaproteobacteria bacterium]|jgi:hypothetical protein|nr:hypothetical protein [Alphaproteobacteria bacterium]